jgi:pimeloyl-ACP methyl ester carboxylesterase
MASVTSKDGTSIAYNTTGTGPALIIVTGATAFRAFDPNLQRLADLLASQYTVINYDRRGRGESGDEGPYDPSTAPKREIDDIAALIDAAGGSASLLGFSSGSVLALEATAAGLPVDTLVMYEPPFILPGADFTPPAKDYVETLTRFGAGDDKDAAPAYFMQSLGMPPEAIEGTKHSPIWPLMQSIGPTIAYDGQIMFDAYYTVGKFPSRWKAVTQPVLILDGDASFNFMAAAADAVAAELPNASRKTLAGQDHGPKPEVMAPELRAFLPH